MEIADSESSLNKGIELPKHGDIELNINKRTRGVYEQYLKNTIENVVQAQEPISETAAAETADRDTYNYLNQTPIEAAFEQTQPVPNTPKKSASESHSNIKLMAVTAITSALIIAATVVTLDMNGILAAFSERSTSFIEQTPMTSTDAGIAEDELVAKAVSIIQHTVDDSLNTVNHAGAHSNARDINQNIIVENRSVSIEPAITYEDFMAEAQNPLYRDNEY
ncbi:hypothetical protein [Psychrobacter sp. ASPA161_6]|uniref:hypothetical protein n=1 Tax=Psychrobacter sp. ASPA161_6 TaxID=3160962 RepID=UPI003F8017F0